jgi:DNA-binding CsgD family transcriptional regulator
MNWKTYVEKKNAKIYVLPSGWDSKDSIAEQLECSPDKVRDHLRPALASGEVEEKQFKVWNADLGRCILVTAYREAQKEVTASEFDLARAQAMKKDGKSYAEIGAAVGMTGEAVRAKLRRAG